MKTYIAQRRIDHDNRVFEDGAQLDLDDSTARPLLAIGAVVAQPMEANPSQPEVNGQSDDGASEDAAKTADDQGLESASSPATPAESADEVVDKAETKKTGKAK